MGQLDPRADPARDEDVQPAAVRRTDILKGYRLGEAEIDALAGAARGETQESTARRRGTALETVKTQRRHAIAKLGARNMTHAVAIAAARGLIEIGP